MPGEGLADGLGVVGQLAGWDVWVTPTQAVPPAVPVGEDVPLGGGDADVGEVGGLLARVAQVNGPQDEHLAADDRVGVGVPVGEYGRLLVGGQGGAKPSSHPWLRRKGGSLTGNSRRHRRPDEQINCHRAGYNFVPIFRGEDPGNYSRCTLFAA